MIKIVILCISTFVIATSADFRKFIDGIEEQVDKNPLNLLQYFENLEKEYKSFQKKFSEWKPKPFNKTAVSLALAQHPLVLEEKNHFERSENKTLVCLIAYYVKFQKLVDDFNKKYRNAACENEKEFRDLLSSTVVSLIKMRKELKKSLNKASNLPSFPSNFENCKKSKFFKGYITEITFKTDIFFKLKTVFSTLKQACFREKFENKEAFSYIQENFVDPINQCITKSHDESDTANALDCLLPSK